MNGQTFYQNVVSHKELEWLCARDGATPAEDEAIIIHKETGIKHAVSVPSILDHTWEELEGVLTGKREPRVMIHLTRIVGYYSRVQNWNRSKLAELKDRQAGQYSAPEPTAPSLTLVA